MDLEVVLVRLRLIVKYCNTLEEFRSITLNEYLGNFHQQLIVERLLQLVVEAATDINKYLLVQLHKISPATNFDSFTEAGRQSIITQDLATKLAQSVGMRNILVHQYKDIDNKIVFSAIPKALEQYRFYVQQVTVYLNSLEAEDG
ncbi:hypothetical protein BZZ01_16695 [Nostocales cyanobacterium HT-58-2]|nr:hypothetical protein BZZ01_16695 [Nostocales cyanobacterium HT-58-2]